jgi:hypothetical protein
MSFTISAAKLLLNLALIGSCCSVTAAPQSTSAAQDAIGASTSAILQGNSAGALKALRKISPTQFFGSDAGYRTCMLGRFDRGRPPSLVGNIDDPFVRGIIKNYQIYWWHTLNAPAKREALEAQLLQRLRIRLGVMASGAHDMDAMEKLLDIAVKARGYHAIVGRTPPLLELMVWKTEDIRYYDVALPESSLAVKVVLMRAFVSRGWSYYGRCGRGGAAGWVGDDAVYAVASAYDLESEEYRASLLAHEAQHFADKQKFPELSSWELEFRAKLAELWAAEKTQKNLLTKFKESQSDLVDSPHTYANKRVLTALRKQLGGDETINLEALSVSQLKDAARTVLVEDSAHRLRARNFVPSTGLKAYGLTASKPKDW